MQFISIGRLNHVLTFVCTPPECDRPSLVPYSDLDLLQVVVENLAHAGPERAEGLAKPKHPYFRTTVTEAGTQFIQFS